MRLVSALASLKELIAIQQEMNVRFWPKADIRLESSNQYSLMTANDPKRTFYKLQ